MFSTDIEKLNVLIWLQENKKQEDILKMLNSKTVTGSDIRVLKHKMIEKENIIIKVNASRHALHSLILLRDVVESASE